MNDAATGEAPTAACPDISTEEARRRLLVRHGLPADGGYSRRWWSIKCGALAIALPNFRWRRAAVPLHDIHHAVTGFACDPRGEMEMAAWEHAAGRFPSVWATLFCLPLVALGAVLAPRRVYAAFLLGRDSRTLYSAPEIGLERPLRDFRAKLLPAQRRSPRHADRLAFTWLVMRSLVLLLLPPFACALIAFAAFA